MLDAAAIRAAYQERFGIHPRLVVRAPGRVNLIGEHTDYNQGFVLPAAIDRATYVAARARPDRLVRAYAADLDREDTFSLDELVPSPTEHWSNYLRGMAKAIQAAGHTIQGADIYLTSNVPRGAGLSSSAALEVAVGYAFQLMNDLNILGEELALMAQGAENNFVGVNSGIMDQFISALGEADHALLIDCRDLSNRSVALPRDASIIVCDSHVERTLAGSAYNQRRSECEQALAILQQWYPSATALRDISVEQFAAHSDALPDVLLRRARHVITENDRVLRAAQVLEAGDVATFGMLMNASHASMRDDYEISVPELNTLVEAAQAVPGCYGSRLTGAGFGGCTVSLVASSAVAAFREQVSAAYRTAHRRDVTIYVCRASPGVGRAVSDF